VTSVIFTRDAAGTSVMTTGRDGNAFINLSNSGFTQAALLGHGAAITAAAFTPDNQIAATASADGSVRLWDASLDNSGPRPAAEMTDVRSNPPGNVVALSPATGAAVTIAGDKTARLWLRDGGVVPLSPSGPVIDAAFSRDGRFIVTAGADGKAAVWTARGRFLQALSHGAGPLTRARLSGDGSVVMTAGKDGRVRLWTRQGVPLGVVAHTEAVNDARFSRDGKLLVTASDDNTAVVWRVSDGQRLATMTGHTEDVVSAAFSPDGARVATGSKDLSARVWDAHSGKQVAVLNAHQGTVNDVAFSSDGRWLATAGPTTAGIWETRKTGRWPFLWTYLVRRHPTVSRINDVAFSPGGTKLFVGSPEALSVYDCRLCGGAKQLVAIARARLGAIVRTKP
jgi:WD40 repeat protein